MHGKMMGEEGVVHHSVKSSMGQWSVAIKTHSKCIKPFWG